MSRPPGGGQTRPLLRPNGGRLNATLLKAPSFGTPAARSRGLALAKPLEHLELADGQPHDVAVNDEPGDPAASAVAVLADQTSGQITRKRRLSVHRSADGIEQTAGSDA